MWLISAISFLSAKWNQINNINCPIKNEHMSHAQPHDGITVPGTFSMALEGDAPAKAMIILSTVIAQHLIDSL